jgi:hypothetical protein
MPTLAIMRLPQNPEDRLKDMMGQAFAFFLAGLRCDDNVVISPKVSESLPTQAVVCFAFAIELYLKIILNISNNKTIKEHSLVKLFDSLPDEFQQNIADKLKMDILSLHNELDKLANAFVDWRYIYEQENIVAISVSNLSNIAGSIHKTIRELRPDLGKDDIRIP